MKPPASPAPSGGDVIIYQTEDGRTRLQVRLQGETVWLSLNQLADLFQRDKSVISKHIRNVFAEGELPESSVVAKFATTAADGKTYQVEYFNLDVIISVGYRVKSHRGTQFRIWATQRLREYIVKGFTMDDERLKNPPGKGQKDYFDEQLERIRDIRSSERRFYQKVLDIYATSVDYTPDAEVSQQFFATVQNKMHWAAHGQTAAEVIHARVDATKPFMGLKTTRPGGIIRKEDVSVAKNYLDAGELGVLNRIVGKWTGMRVTLSLFRFGRPTCFYQHLCPKKWNPVLELHQPLRFCKPPPELLGQRDVKSNWGDQPDSHRHKRLHGA